MPYAPSLRRRNPDVWWLAARLPVSLSYVNVGNFGVRAREDLRDLVL